MNLMYAEVLSVHSEHGVRVGNVRVRGALSTVPLYLVSDARAGDTVLVCDGVAIGRVSERGHSCPPPEHPAGEADTNVRTPTAHVAIGKVGEESRQSSIIGGSNVSRYSR
jgi:hydrogenase maturation factor